MLVGYPDGWKMIHVLYINDPFFGGTFVSFFLGGN